MISAYSIHNQYDTGQQVYACSVPARRLAVACLVVRQNLVLAVLHWLTVGRLDYMDSPSGAPLEVWAPPGAPPGPACTAAAQLASSSRIIIHAVQCTCL
jgi:hypothetical protein